MGSIVSYQRVAITTLHHSHEEQQAVLLHSNASRDPGWKKFGSGISATKKCCGSESRSGSESGSNGSTCFLASRIRIRLWIRVLLSPCKNNKKNLESYYFVTVFDFLSLKNNVSNLRKVTSRKNCVKKLVFCWHLEGR
jgi:hypothetical protein